MEGMLNQATIIEKLRQKNSLFTATDFLKKFSD
jgi:hypothetical protein